MQTPFSTPTLCRRSINHQVSEFVRFVSVCVANGGLSCLDFRSVTTSPLWRLKLISGTAWDRASSQSGPIKWRAQSHLGRRSLKCRQSRAAARAASRQELARCLCPAPEWVCSWPLRPSALLPCISLIVTDFLASSGQVLHMLQTGTSMRYIAVVLSSAGRCPQRNFPGEGTQLGWTEVLCPASRQAPNGV